jgi:hypothetical protein
LVKKLSKNLLFRVLEKFFFVDPPSIIGNWLKTTLPTGGSGQKLTKKLISRVLSQFFALTPPPPFGFSVLPQKVVPT